jgi:hypothetical protein
MFAFVFELAERLPGAQRNRRLIVKAPSLWEARELFATMGDPAHVLRVHELPALIMANNNRREGS